MKRFIDSINDKKMLNDTLMGPNALKLAAELTEGLPLKSGMKVLDLGCGTGVTSMFLAETFGVTVFATDLWISPTDNLNRFRQFGLEDRVYPIHAEAHDLPYAEGFFDAVVSIDSYHYYGAEGDYLQKFLAPLVKKGGIVAVAIPGLQYDFEDGIPSEMQPFLQEDMHFHSRKWWHDLWQKSAAVINLRSSSLSYHKEAWADWLECDNEYAIRDIEMMKAENGQYFDTIALVGAKA